MNKLLIFILFFFTLPAIAWAQAADEHQHAHGRNEIGISPGAVYCLEHNEWGFGLHTHYFRTFSAHSKWSFGGGFETVWTDGMHFTVGAGIKYQILETLSIAAMPGVTFLKHEEHGEEGFHAQFGFHAEIVYDIFHTEKFHLGPLLDYAWTNEDSHFMLGVHFAYTF